MVFSLTVTIDRDRFDVFRIIAHPLYLIIELQNNGPNQATLEINKTFQRSVSPANRRGVSFNKVSLNEKDIVNDSVYNC
jgi:hypothetical protein